MAFSVEARLHQGKRSVEQQQHSPDSCAGLLPGVHCDKSVELGLFLSLTSFSPSSLAPQLFQLCLGG